jgi:hypothetical protein
MATTSEKDLVVDPCAGSFIVLETCQEINRNFLGCDLTLLEQAEHLAELTSLANNKKSELLLTNHE